MSPDPQPTASVMQKISASTFKRIVLIYLVAIGLVVGTLTAFFVHHRQPWLLSILTGIFCGILGTGGAFLFLLAALRIISLVRFVRHVRRTKNQDLREL
jgi:drug/metabolite transporter (DMT)-like permease